jgi:transcriptional regulator with XRE-family HTH domain
MTFAETLKKFRKQASKSRYRLAEYSGLTQPYILRLENGERGNPSRDVVLMLGFALVEGSDSVAIWDIDELLMSAEYAPLRKRGGVTS